MAPTDPTLPTVGQRPMDAAFLDRLAEFNGTMIAAGLGPALATSTQRSEGGSSS